MSKALRKGIHFRPVRWRRSGFRRPNALWMPLAALVAAGAIVVVVTSETVSGTAGGRGDAIVGQASVVDGDTLQIYGTRIRLHGIDAPESDQSCTVRDERVACGRLATMALVNKIGGRTVACEPKNRDHYGRVVALCRSGDEDLNAWLVSQGWAMAYRRYSWAYMPEEIAARWNRVGIWEGDFVAPWVWRHRQQH